MIEIGQKAPEFTLPDKNGEMHSLSDYRGKKVVVYFYPKDNTSGCTAQACAYQAAKQEYSDKNAVVLGISKDSQASHVKFAEKFGLEFTLLSDPELEAIKAYDVWRLKKMAGREYMGVVRSTFVVDEEGSIIHADYKVKAKDDAAKVLKLL